MFMPDLFLAISAEVEILAFATGVSNSFNRFYTTVIAFELRSLLIHLAMRLRLDDFREDVADLPT